MKASMLFAISLTVFSTAFYGVRQTPQQSVNYQKLGDSLSLKAQQTLISNLMGAIEKGGAAYAVDFCNENAMPLTHSISTKRSVDIQRISVKNRNPDNAASLFDKKILDLFESNSLKDTLVRVSKGYVYYKPIKIGMPTCLQCHGKPKQDIEAATLKTIQRKYRFDKATGYAMGDLRGAWKLAFPDK
ncbi:Tll0287-like domain-containing protein [Runella sp.]|uniref:Tll0287-like domain-containing protein n=1 Tax=Runella sp. TaxID=1960881 RepID=UPI003D098434